MLRTFLLRLCPPGALQDHAPTWGRYRLSSELQQLPLSRKELRAWGTVSPASLYLCNPKWSQFDENHSIEIGGRKTGRGGRASKESRCGRLPPWSPQHIEMIGHRTSLPSPHSTPCPGLTLQWQFFFIESCRRSLSPRDPSLLCQPR